MTIKRIQVGPRMSQAVIHGNTVYLAGQVCPADAGATTVAAQDQSDSRADRSPARRSRHEQAEPAVRDRSGCRTWARSSEMNEVWDKWVVQGSTPARATVEARLAGPQYLIEIAAIAAIG